MYQIPGRQSTFQPIKSLALEKSKDTERDEHACLPVRLQARLSAHASGVGRSRQVCVRLFRCLSFSLFPSDSPDLDLPHVPHLHRVQELLELSVLLREHLITGERMS